jgi:Family of unknown function (DUF5677)
VIRRLIGRVVGFAFSVLGRIGGRRKLRRWNRDAASEIRYHREQVRGFEERLHLRWAAGIDSLELLWLHVMEESDAYHQRQINQVVEEQDITFDALAQLHARACRAASESLTLLRTGYAEGAHTRWRTLHEIAVTMFFIQENDADLAERYLLHTGTQEWRAAQQYQRYQQELGSPPLSDQEMSDLEAHSDELVGRFGATYIYPYGWAADALGKKRPTFVDIEKAVSMDRWRPWYRMASEAQHAGSRALAYTLGVIAPAEARLTGASNAGLVEPGSGTAISLAQASTAFLTFRPDLRAVQAALAILQLSREVEERFEEAAVRLDADEMRARQEREPGEGLPHWSSASLIGD